MIMLVSVMTSSAGTVNVKVNVNQDAVTNLAASLGVPENQLQLIPPATALINTLDVNVTVLDDGGQADLDLGGRDSSASRSRRNAGSSTIDPDDNDIEAYYQDNIDEYDDYDDAYEGFLDDD